MNEPRILLADDHAEMESVVRDQLGMKASVGGIAYDGVELLSGAEILKPDVILLDISMPRMNGLDAARRLLAMMPALRIIFLTAHDRPFYVTEAFRLGAQGYVLKSSAHELPIAIDRVMQGNRFLSATLRDAHPELIPTDLHG